MGDPDGNRGSFFGAQVGDVKQGAAHLQLMSLFSTLGDLPSSDLSDEIEG
jgi:hypothetical protein